MLGLLYKLAWLNINQLYLCRPALWPGTAIMETPEPGIMLQKTSTALFFVTNINRFDGFIFHIPCFQPNTDTGQPNGQINFKWTYSLEFKGPEIKDWRLVGPSSSAVCRHVLGPRHHRAQDTVLSCPHQRHSWCFLFVRKHLMIKYTISCYHLFKGFYTDGSVWRGHERVLEGP